MNHICFRGEVIEKQNSSDENEMDVTGGGMSIDLELEGASIFPVLREASSIEFLLFAF